MENVNVAHKHTKIYTIPLPAVSAVQVYLQK